MAANVKGTFAPLPGQAEGCFVPKLTLGASKNAANGDTAMKFIEYALGEQSQNINLMEGFPLNVKALNDAQARGKTRFGLMSTGDWTNVWLGADSQKKPRGIIDALTTPVVPDFTLFKMLVEESDPFFAGTITARQAAQNLRAKANTYLSE